MAEYIDKTALLEKVIIPSVSSVLDGNTAERIKKFCIDTVKNAPSADVAPVKHGHNANEKYHAVDEFRCSECGMHIEGWSAYYEDEDDGEYTAEYEFRYCPNCGARMDGDTT